MFFLRWFAILSLFVHVSLAATVGTVVPLVGGASDILLDEPRQRIYLANGSQDRIEVYSVQQRRFLNSVHTDALPISLAMSRSGRYLYVTCHNGSALDIIDLNPSTPVLTGRATLPARPEGVAVGFDEKVLITTIGTGQNNAQNTLLIYDPSPQAAVTIDNVLIAPAAPQPPQLPPLAGRIFLANRSQLLATRDGRKIIGLNATNQSTRVVFVYDVASRAVIKSRIVGDISTVLSISPDGSRFMVGLRLFETDTLTVLAQMNAANAPFPLTANLTTQGLNQVAQQFNLQQNQGGSVFAPDGSFVFGAFNIAPIQNPPARANVTQFFLCDPDNLLIQMGMQLPENLAGKIVIASDGSAAYGLSDSGFTIIPVATLRNDPIASLSSTVALLANDQCGVTADLRSTTVNVNNEGRGRLTANASLLSLATGTPALGGSTGAGGGIVGGGGITIILPPISGANTQTQQLTASAPQVRTSNTPNGPQLTFTFNPVAGRTPGSMTHDFLVQSPEAVNIPPLLRVFQNQRDTEAVADIVPIPVNYSPSEGLVDMVLDSRRNFLYIANSGLNRVDIFDTKQKTLRGSIKVGQLPHALALTPDGNTLYVGNTGGEAISIIDLVQMKTVGRVQFPPIPFNGNLSIMFPSAMAATMHGLEVVMNNGTLWTVIGQYAIPRPISPTIQTSTVPAPRQMTATPGGEYAILLDGNGYAYLYDALADNYVQRKQVVPTPIQGYYGPISAGPRGQYYLVNGLVLNGELVPILSAGSVVATVPGRGTSSTQTLVKPIYGVAAADNTSFVRFATPTRAAANATVTDYPTVEVVDARTGAVTKSVPAVEGPISTVVGNQRANVIGRAMAVEPDGSAAYVLTNSGLSIVPLNVAARSDSPFINNSGIVSMASYLPKIAPGGLFTVFGRNLGQNATAPSTALPTILGGACVTLNNQPLPLLMTSPTQINGQIPPDLTLGSSSTSSASAATSQTARFSLVVRSTDKKAASNAASMSITKYAPAVFVDDDGTASIFHADGSPVTRDHPARRDQKLVMYATGLGPTKGGKVTAGKPAPSDPPALTDPVQVYFGDPSYKQSAVIVDWSGLMPGGIGIYQLNLRVPGFHMASKGSALPVTVRIGGVDSPKTGPAVPSIWVD